MEDRTKEGYDAINYELANVEATYKTLKIKEAYKTREDAVTDAKTFNEMTMKIAKLKKLTEIKDFYKKQYKNCTVDIFLDPPFENCSLLGYEKQVLNIEYDALKAKKDKTLVGVGYSGTVSTISNSINLREDGYYDTIYVLKHIIKSAKVSYYVRITKKTSEKTISLNDKSFNYIDVAYFKKPSKTTIGFNLFKIFSFLSSFALIAAFIMIILQTIGCNFVIGRKISVGKLNSLSNGFVNFFSSPVLQIILLSLIGVYLVSQIIVISTIKHYNKIVSIKNYEMLKNIPTQIVNTIVILLVFTFFLFTNAVSFAYCAAPNLPYGESNGIFSKLTIIKRFADIAHLESTKSFTFASNLEAAIYLGGVAISFSELVGMLYVIGRIAFTIYEIIMIISNSSDIEMVLNERSKLTDKKLAEYEKMLKEFNENLVTIDDTQLFLGVIKRIPSIFDSESGLRESKKIKHIQNGRFNPAKLFVPAIFIPLICIVFFVFDAIHNVCATSFFPGSNFVKIIGYFVLIAISFGAGIITGKIYSKNNKLDD